MESITICKTEDEKAYGWYIPLGGKTFCSGVTCDIPSLIVNIKSNAYQLMKPSCVETKVPEIDFGNLRKSLFGLVSAKELSDVQSALGLSKISSE